jgi:hypothetical protein
LEEENETRNELAQQMAKKEATSTGGYHSVAIPLAATAKSALDRMKSGEINFVSLVGSLSTSSHIFRLSAMDNHLLSLMIRRPLILTDYLQKFTLESQGSICILNQENLSVIYILL